MAIHEYELSSAIHGHRRVRFHYRGDTRVVEPCAFGVDAGGAPILRAFEVVGEGEPHARGWALFHVDEIVDLSILDQTFAAPRDGYMRNDPAMTKIYAEL